MLKRLVLILYTVGILFSFSSSQTPADKRIFEMKDADTTYVMKEYYFCLLKRGDNPPKFSKVESDSIQKGHLASISRLAKEGKIVMAGPFGDDTDSRGILIFDTENIEEARRLQSLDPAVQSGRLKAEFHPWWAARGSILK